MVIKIQRRRTSRKFEGLGSWGGNVHQHQHQQQQKITTTNINPNTYINILWYFLQVKIVLELQEQNKAESVGFTFTKKNTSESSHCTSVTSWRAKSHRNLATWKMTKMSSEEKEWNWQFCWWPVWFNFYHLLRTQTNQRKIHPIKKRKIIFQTNIQISPGQPSHLAVPNVHPEMVPMRDSSSWTSWTRSRGEAPMSLHWFRGGISPQLPQVFLGHL